MSTVGERIKERRKALGMPQEELGDLIGESKQQIYKYEKGTITNIPLEKIEKLASALRVTPSYLVGWDDSIDYKFTTHQLLSSIPFVSLLLQAAEQEKKPANEILSYFESPEGFPGMLYLLRYASLKQNDELFLANFFGRSVSEVLQFHFSLSLSDAISAYSREEVNIIRQLRSLPQDKRDLVKGIIGLVDGSEEKQNEALSRDVV